MHEQRNSGQEGSRKGRVVMPKVKTKDGKVRQFGYTAAEKRAAEAFAKSTGGQLLADPKREAEEGRKKKAKGY